MKKYIVGMVLLWTLGSLSGCQKIEEVPVLLEPVGVEMDTAVVEYGDINTISIYSGEVVPYVEEAAFSVDGKIQEFKVSVGDMVEAGQLLAKLDDSKLLEEIESLEAKIKDIQIMGSFHDRKAAADIEIAIERLEMLQSGRSSDENIKAQQLEIQLLQLGLEEAVVLRNQELDKLNKKLQALKSEAGNMLLKAPISGRVVYMSEVNVGHAVQKFTTMVCIADESSLSISSEYIAPNLLKNAYKISAQILDKEYDVTYVPYEDTEYVKLLLSGGALSSKFVLAENAEVESGQYAVVKLWSVNKEHVLTVPVNAVYRDQKGRYVYKIVDGERVRCDIKEGLVSETKAEILEGLKEGEVVYVKE
jgi:multidrug efflux pump subunit AcrA (membrane-fusion protein)